MGDKEFENFLNEENEDNINHAPMECQKKLLFDIIQQKMDNSTNLIGIYSDLHVKFPSLGYDHVIAELKKISDVSFEQLDYLISIVINEINGEDSNE